MRHEIMQQITLRQAPDLRFYLDTSLEYGMQIDAKLAEIKAQQADSPATSATEPTEQTEEVK